MPINYQEISQLNVQGLLAMQQNSHGRALSFFQRCLSILLQGHGLTRHRDKSVDSYDQTPTQIPTTETESLHQHHQNRTIVSIPLSTSNDLETEEEIFTLFNRGLHLPCNDSNTDPTEDFHVNIIIAAICYNVGLTHQVAGLKQGNSSMLSNALEFYSMAYTSVTNAPDETEQSPVSAKLCLLAIGNNITCVHAYFRRMKLTKICCEDILKLLTTVLPLEEIPGAPLSAQEEYRVFLLNVSLFSESDLSTAPAPAA